MTISHNIDEEIRKFEKQLEKEVNDMIYINGVQLFKKIIDRTPVVTGTLKDGWKFNSSKVDGYTAIDITNDVEYAIYVEEGTDKFSGRHMVDLSVAEQEREMNKGKLK